MPQPNTNKTSEELRKHVVESLEALAMQIVDRKLYVPSAEMDGGIGATADTILGSLDAAIAEARKEERKQVALDNYQGQTFSDATDYKGKFDKFIRNNERRISKLESLINKKEEET